MEKKEAADLESKRKRNQDSYHTYHHVNANKFARLLLHDFIRVSSASMAFLNLPEMECGIMSMETHTRGRHLSTAEVFRGLYGENRFQFPL